MKRSLLFGLCISIFPLSISKALSLTETHLPCWNIVADQVGVVVKDADFWIGHPQQSGSMPFLKISAGGKVIIKGQDKEYYLVLYREMLGYVKRDLIEVEKPVRKKEPEMEPEVQFQAKPVDTPAPARYANQYRVTKATSLRVSPDSQSRVLVRLPVDGVVTVLESSGRWWWKVRYGDREGWAKRALLNKE